MSYPQTETNKNWFYSSFLLHSSFQCFFKHFLGLEKISLRAFCPITLSNTEDKGKKYTMAQIQYNICSLNFYLGA